MNMCTTEFAACAFGLAPNKKTCAAGPSKGNASILSGSITTPLPEVGAAIGSLFGPEGAFVGAIFGSMFGGGANVSYVPSNGSLYVGPTVTFGLGLSGGGGISGNAVSVPPNQNPNSIANGLSFSLTYQPLPILGSTVSKSPGSGPPVVGPSVGTRIPFAASVSYNFCVAGCC